jgi:hypothetical protein
MLATTTTTTTNDNNNDTTNTNTNANATAQPQEEQPLQEEQPPKKMKERRPKWMRPPTPFEKQRGALLILEAAGLLRPRRGVAAVAVAAVADGSSSCAAVAVAWRAVLALHRRLRAPPVVAATRRLFPAFVALAMRQDPGTMATDGVKYEMSALPKAFVLAQHPHRFRHCEALGQTMMGESAREEQEAQLALMDAGAALAETFEALLTGNEFRLRPRRRYARMTPADAPGGERISPPLLLQLRAYEDAVAALRAAAPTRASSSSSSV